MTTFANRRCGRVHLGLGDAEHLRRGDGVDVEAAFERVDEARVLGEVREHAQLDLRVVGGEQAAAVVGDERAAELAAVGRAHRDVLQVRRLARDAAGRRVGLLEGRVHAAVGPDERRERVGVGASAASRPRGSAGGPSTIGWSSAIFCSESASVDGPVFVFLTGVRPSFSKSTTRSCGVELTLNSSPAMPWIWRTSVVALLGELGPQVVEEDRSTRMPACSILASTRTSGRSNRS